MEGKKDEQTLGKLIQKGFYLKVVLIGFPYDEGDVASANRKGCKYGPDSFRRFVTKIGVTENAEYNADLSQIGICDYGNIIPPSGFPYIEESYKKIATKLTLNFQRIQLPVIIGGSRDYVPAAWNAFSTFYGVNSTLIYINPYTDMKSVQGTNSVIKNILTHKSKESSIIHFGLSIESDKAEVEESKALGAEIIFQSQIKKYPHKESTKAGSYFRSILDQCKEKVYVSFSMESIRV